MSFIPPIDPLREARGILIGVAASTLFVWGPLAGWWIRRG